MASFESASTANTSSDVMGDCISWSSQGQAWDKRAVSNTRSGHGQQGGAGQGRASHH